MNNHSLQVLEFPKILTTIAENCCTSWYKETILKEYRPRFFTDQSQAENCYLYVNLISRLISHPSFSISGYIEDFRPVIDLLRIDGTVADLETVRVLLSPLKDAISLGGWSNAEVLIDELSFTKDQAGILAQFFYGLDIHRDLLRFLRKYLDDTGRLKEEEIPELVQIQKQIQKINQDLMGTAKGLMSTNSAFYSSDTPVFREGRVLLPVKTDYKGRVDGLFHGLSDTGSTVYMETGALLQQNNGLNEAKANYNREIHRILRLISQEIRQKIDSLDELFHFWDRFDGFYMRARWMVNTRSIVPQFSRNECTLNKARHPLLGKGVVPLDLRFLPNKRIILISGPNTGGKTVAIKTLGLMVLLSQFGIPIPAEEGSSLPWFQGVFADIGDEQSIEESLSTFSAHLKNISQILTGAGSGSLVLLDELGTGTDPQEGGALALAILEELVQKKAYGVITSHHSSLKAYAYSHPDMENASMEFDSRNKIPTYSIRYGIPGASRALEIAQSVGFPGTVLNKAKLFLDAQSNPLEKLIEELGEKERTLSIAIQENAELNDDLSEKMKEYRRASDKLAQEKVLLKQQQLSETNLYLIEARKTIEQAISEFQIKAQGMAEASVTGENDREKKELFNALRNQAHSQFEKITNDRIRNKNEIKHLAADRIKLLKPGLEVRVEGTTQKGTLLKKLKDGRWLVAAGMVKLTLESHQLIPVEETDKQSRYFEPEYAQKQYFHSHESTRLEDQGSTVRPKFTLDLRGFRLEEALRTVQEQIEGSAVHGLDFFGIIHGKGTGILQAGIHELLSSHSMVQEYFFARPEDGGTGKTLVYLKRN